MKADIELYLLMKADWVSSRELCQRFNVSERKFRSSNGHAGLCSDFAISGDKGFKHVRHATASEFDDFVSRIRSHGIAELTRVRVLRQTRSNIQSGHPAFEKFSGQGMLPVRI